MNTARNILRKQNGTVLLELVLSCLVLVAFMFASIEIWGLVQDKVHLQRVVRDAAREAVLTGDTREGREKGYDRARQYFGNREVEITVIEQKDNPQSHLVVSEATLVHPIFGRGNTVIPKWWEKDVTLHAQAIFGYKDFAESYE